MSKSRSNRYKSSKQQKKSKKNIKANPYRQRLILVVALAVLILGAIGFFFLNDGQPFASAAAKTISLEQAYEKYTQGVFFLDVRTQKEWEDYHLPSSTLIPLNELEQRVNELPDDQEIIVVCGSGSRSKQGREILQAAGFSQVTCMDDGLDAWKKAGFPTTSGP